jgi:glycosyltransferase involved in cell wall biosynthesis
VGPYALVGDAVTPDPVNITMVTYDRAEFTRRSIDSIAATAGHPYLLTVVDNGSRDGTVELLREFHAKGSIHRLILNTVNKGVAYAANQGWSAISSSHYMKIDNDIVFTRTGWLQALVKACESLPDIGAVGYSFETTSYPLEVIGGVPVRPKDGNLGGAAIMIPESTHRLVGFWCEDYFPYGEEDLDMEVRLRLLGLRSYYMEDEDVGLHLPEGKASPIIDEGRQSVFDEDDVAYRAQKDRWRALHSGPRGLRRINESLYRRGLRSLYVEHGVRYRPDLRARLFVWARYRQLDPWKREQSTERPASP